MTSVRASVSKDASLVKRGLTGFPGEGVALLIDDRRLERKRSVVSSLFTRTDLPVSFTLV